MKKDKFLTVMAVLDDDTQKLLSKIQDKIISAVPNGTQTMGISFHISLGSYPPEREREISDRVKKISSATRRFPIDIKGYNSFGESVLYAEPSIPDELLILRSQFECDYAEGFDWVPHITLFCGDAEAMKRARELLPKISEPICAEIVGLELGEFFPTRIIMKGEFK